LLLIVQTVIQSARWVPTVLVGDDADLVLLCYDLFFFKARAQEKVQEKKSLRHTKVFAGSVCVYKYFVRARISWMWHNLQAQWHWKGSSKAFNRPGVTKEEIVLAGEKALVCLYNCKSPDESLDSLSVSSDRNNLYTAGEPFTNVGSCRVSQQESVLPNTAVERDTVQAWRLGMEIDCRKAATRENRPAARLTRRPAGDV